MYPRLPPISDKPLTKRQARLSGVILILLGFFIVVIVAGLAGFFLGLISLEQIIPGVYRDPGAGPVSAGIPAWIFVGFFGVFGLVSIVNGGWHIALGRRNRPLTMVMWVMAASFILAGIVARGLN